MATSTLRLARPVRAEVVRHMRRHDLVFYAAGLTFYASIAIVPLLLVAWWVTSLVLGDDLVDEPVLDGLLGLEEAVALQVRVDLLDRLPGVVGEDLVDAAAHLEDLPGVDVDVRGLAFEDGRGLVDEHP